MQNKNNFNIDDLDNQTTNKGDFSMKKLVQAQKKEKERRFRNLKIEICKQEKSLLDNKKILEEKERKNNSLIIENQVI